MRRRRQVAAGPLTAIALAAIALAAWLLGLLAASSAMAQSRADPETASGVETKPLATSERWMIVTANPLASEAGADVLREGGSAVDAAIAAQLVLNVVEPQSSGIGGGGFALHWDAATRSASSWDGRETAPSGATETMFLGPDGEPMAWPDAVATGLSIGTPSLVRLMEALHREHGQLDWSRLFQPAIGLAHSGFPVSPRLAASIDRFQDRLRASPAAAELFFDAEGAPLAAGAMLQQRALASTLRAVASGGAEIFYQGRIAEAILAAVSAEPTPGSMTQDDLSFYAVIRQKPVCADYRERYAVCGMGPPSSGATTVGQMLGLLDQFAVAEMEPEDPAAWHLFAEASKLAYADRAAFLADEGFVDVPTTGLLDAGYLAMRAALIDPAAASTERAMAGDPPWKDGRLDQAPDPSLGRPGTTHLSVVDSAGNALSLTSSIETAFGSGRMAAGFLLNNQLTDFSFRPERDGRPIANRGEPEKRPRSSMAPTIVFDTAGGDMRPMLVLGSPGGSRIPEYVAGALVRMLDWSATPDLAAAAPHVSQRNGEKTAIDEGVAGDAIADALADLGHVIDRRAMTSGLHIIAIDDAGRLSGGADPRREGVAIGE